MWFIGSVKLPRIKIRWHLLYDISVKKGKIHLLNSWSAYYNRLRNHQSYIAHVHAGLIQCAAFPSSPSSLSAGARPHKTSVSPSFYSPIYHQTPRLPMQQAHVLKTIINKTSIIIRTTIVVICLLSFAFLAIFPIRSLAPFNLP